MNNIALDTNVLIYLFDASNADKRNKADTLLLLKPLIPAQVISEFLNVSKRLLKLPKHDIIKRCRAAISNCTIVPTTHHILEQAELLIIKYDFQLFDAIVIASALAVKCSILYTEDMHHGLVVENTLTLINPFI